MADGVGTQHALASRLVSYISYRSITTDYNPPFIFIVTNLKLAPLNKMSSAAFGETLQFVTNVKLHELEKHRQAFSAHAEKVLERAHAAPDAIARVDALVKGIEEWQGTWSAETGNLKNIQAWIEEVSSYYYSFVFRKLSYSIFRRKETQAFRRRL